MQLVVNCLAVRVESKNVVLDWGRHPKGNRHGKHKRHLKDGGGTQLMYSNHGRTRQFLSPSSQQVQLDSNPLNIPVRQWQWRSEP